MMASMSDPPPQPPSARRTETRWGCLGVLVGGFFLVMLSAIIWARRQNAEDESFRAAGRTIREIHKALWHYANDHEGYFPTGTTTSNQAYRQLFPEYLTQEDPFYVRGSAWHDAAPDRKPDNKIGPPPGFPEALERGENHWAYISGLKTTSDSKYPLLADGFVEGQPGTYTNKRSKKGGRWAGKKAIVIHVDGSAVLTSPSRKPGSRSEFHILAKGPRLGETMDAYIERRGPKAGESYDVFVFPPSLPGIAGPIILNPE